jgi:hypothetical protein
MKKNLVHLLIAHIFLTFNFKVVQLGKHSSEIVNPSQGCVTRKSDNSIAKKIALFGNGIVALSVHHTLIVIDYGNDIEQEDERYRLLEIIGDSKVRIHVHDKRGKNETEALNKRVREDLQVDRWGEDTWVYCRDSTIQNVIDSYQCTNYVAYSLLGKPRNCRTFINDIFRACGSSKRTGSWRVIE